MAQKKIGSVHDLQTILQISQALTAERDLDRLLWLIISACSRLVDADRSSLFIVDQSRDELWTKVAEQTTTIRLPMGSGIAGTVAKEGQTLNIVDAYQDQRFNPIVDHKSGYRTKSVLCMPLINSSGEVVGVIETINKKNGKAFTARDEQLLGALCSHAAIALDNARLLRQDLAHQSLLHELELAHSIQQGLLPQSAPSISGWTFAIYQSPCEQTGGDYHDFIPHAHCQAVDVVVGDVSGHGVSAALLMSTARAFLRALDQDSTRPGQLLEQINHLLVQDMADDRFMTMVVCRLDESGHVRYASAGHEPPIVFRTENGYCDENVETDLLLGMLDGVGYAEYVLPPLNRGDLLVLCTDGVFEAVSPHTGEVWGMERLRELVRKQASVGASALCQKIMESISDYTDHSPQKDDITLLIAEKT
ncbi:MAG: hypothetical protein C0614_00155 [Desulfuromonas sp.]|nr:MAG: hypothetical protein C0614_00155 [Desulfuromonas sp.]